MEKSEFLEKNIFLDLETIHNESNSDATPYFSESDFGIILERIEKFGIGIYGIESILKGEVFGTKVHDEYRKKATDPKWYKKAFFEFKKQQTNLQYSATYKVSDKLLNRE